MLKRHCSEAPKFKTPSMRKCASRIDKAKEVPTYQIYKQAKNHITKGIGKEKRRASDDLYANLGTNIHTYIHTHI